MKKTTTAKTEDVHAPNIAFVGGREGREPLRAINNGSSEILLPADQSKPFYHEQASTIIRLYGWLYKPVSLPNIK